MVSGVPVGAGVVVGLGSGATPRTVAPGEHMVVPRKGMSSRSLTNTQGFTSVLPGGVSAG